MTLGGQFRTSVRSIRAVGVSPKAISGGVRGGREPPPALDLGRPRCPKKDVAHTKTVVYINLDTPLLGIENDF